MPKGDGTTSTVVAIHLRRRELVILGSEYAGEMKKGAPAWPDWHTTLISGGCRCEHMVVETSTIDKQPSTFCLLDPLVLH